MSVNITYAVESLRELVGDERASAMMENLPGSVTLPQASSLALYAAGMLAALVVLEQVKFFRSRLTKSGALPGEVGMNDVDVGSQH